MQDLNSLRLQSGKYKKGGGQDVVLNSALSEINLYVNIDIQILSINLSNLQSFSDIVFWNSRIKTRIKRGVNSATHKKI